MSMGIGKSAKVGNEICLQKVQSCVVQNILSQSTNGGKEVTLFALVIINFTVIVKLNLPMVFEIRWGVRKGIL